jgi:hypothetical protein
MTWSNYRYDGKPDVHHKLRATRFYSAVDHPDRHSAAASRAPAKVRTLVPIRARLGYGSALHKTVRQATVQLDQARNVLEFIGNDLADHGTKIVTLVPGNAAAEQSFWLDRRGNTW